MNIYHYIMEKNYKSTPEILKGAKEELYNRVFMTKQHPKEKLLELQDFLQENFYGSSKESQILAQNFFNEVISLYEKIMNQKVVGKNDWGTSRIEALGALSEQGLLSKVGNVTHKSQIYVSTLQKRLAELDKLSNSLLSSSQLKIDNLTKLQEQIEMAITEIDVILQEQNSTTKQIRLKKYSKQYNMAQYIDKTYMDILKSTRMGFADLGKLLEYGMAMLDAQVMGHGKNIAYDLIKDNLGSKQVERDGVNMSVVFEEGSKYGSDIKKITDSSVTVGGLEIKTNFSNATSAKADVIFHIPNYSDAFNISLKNWGEFYSSGSRYGFGETSIIAAVARAKPSNSVLEHYLYALGPREASENQINAMHQYSKLCLAVDIITGHSMKGSNRNADTIVINDRSRRHFFVFSAKEMIDSIYENNKNVLLFDGYDEQKIRNFSKDYLDMLTRWNTRHSNLYKGAVINMLNTFRVRVVLKGAI